MRTSGARGRDGRRAWLRLVPPLVCAAAVIAGMLVTADRAQVRADRARQAEVMMQQVRNDTQRVELLTWRSLATTRTASPETVAQGLEAYKQVVADVRALRRLGVDGEDVRGVEREVGSAYGLGINALAISRQAPAAGRQVALGRFGPAMQRVDGSIGHAARRLDAVARAALLRARILSVGSLALGLLLLGLLAWRLHRVERGSALAEQARAVERWGEERLHALVRHSADVVAVTDREWTVRWLAESVRGMLGYEPAELLGRRLTDLVHGDDAPLAAGLLHDLDAASPRTISLRMHRADGEVRDVELVADDRTADPLIDGVLLNMRDASERAALQEALQRQAFRDSLTGLANRALFEERLGHALARLPRAGNAVAIMFLDLDDFKTVNDSLGHGAGDELLRVMAERVQTELRAQDTAARLGGDEFAVLLENPADEAQALAVAERVRRALEPPLTIAGRRLSPSASIGVACAEADDTPETLLRKVDVAMYAAKARGKARVAAFEPSMQEQAIERLELSGELSVALANEELTLDYQPIIALEGGAVVGLEALLRWDHPARGRLAPDRFIALGESTGLIVPIGAWVLDTACAHLRGWRDRHPQLRISVNVSPLQLAEGTLPAQVRRALEASGIAPEHLTLELTEGVLVDDSEAMRRQLGELKDLGVRLAVDDFGTGYSALSYLRAFPLDVLKLDRSFITGLDQDAGRAQLVGGIIDMAHSLGLAVVSEGVEEAAEAALLHDLGCEYGQGYHFARPVARERVIELLASTRAAAGRFTG